MVPALIEKQPFLQIRRMPGASRPVRPKRDSMLSLLLGYCPSLIGEIEDICPAGRSRIEIYGSASHIFDRLSNRELRTADVLFFNADLLTQPDKTRLIKAARSAAPHIIVVETTERGALPGSRGARKAAGQARADGALKIPDDLPRLREILAGAAEADTSPAPPASEYRDLERKLAHAQGRMQAVLDQLAEGVAIIDQRGIVTRVNGKLLDILGADDASALVGRPCHAALWGLPSPCGTCPRLNGNHAIQESRTVERNGACMLLDVSATLITAASAGVGTVETIRDASPRLRLEERMIETEKMKAIGLIAAGMAHELRNPLAIISATAECCLQAEDDPDLASGLESIMNAARSAEKVIGELLTFARPAPDFFEPVQLGKLLQSTVSMVSAECRKRGVEIELDLPDDCPVANADRNKLQQALLNFMLNGAEAMGTGGLLAVSARMAGGSSIEIAIADTGPGMTAEQLSRVFEPFYSTKRGGVGLGMSISKKIILAHQGHVRIDSSPGSGTTVRIALPAAETVEHRAIGIA